MNSLVRRILIICVHLRASVSNKGFYFKARKFEDDRSMEPFAACGNELDPFEFRFFTNNPISPVSFNLDIRQSKLSVFESLWRK